MIKFYTFVPSSGPVVQWIEYQIPVLQVVGSSPAGVTIRDKLLKLVACPFFFSPRPMLLLQSSVSVDNLLLISKFVMPQQFNVEEQLLKSCDWDKWDELFKDILI